jgi:hypothetical protein
MGFVLMAVWCSACAGSFNKLLPPNNDQLLDGTDPVWRSQATGWCVMFACTFFFAAWGPLSTAYILPAELFPSAWRATGYGLCAAAGSLGSIVGIWIFVYASQPFPRQVTYAYPCTRTDAPADLYNMGVGSCLRLPACPVGRQLPTENNVGFPCSYCPDGTKSGCYPYGLGTAGSMAIMVPILAVGAVVTMLLPLTDNRSLEEISLDEQEHENFLGGQRRTLELPNLAAPPVRDVYMERGYEEAHPRGTEADPAMRAQRELDRQRARADMLAKERAKAQLVATVAQRVPTYASDRDNRSAGVKMSAGGDDDVRRKQMKFSGGGGGFTEAMPPVVFSQYDDNHHTKQASPTSPASVPLARLPPGADDEAPMARPPPGLEVLSAATRINQRLQSTDRDPPLARPPPGAAFSEPRAARSPPSHHSTQLPAGVDVSDADESLDSAPEARMPPDGDFTSAPAPSLPSGPFSKQQPPLPTTQAPLGIAGRPPMVVVPLAPVLKAAAAEDPGAGDNIPVTPLPPNPKTPAAATGVPTGSQEVDNPMRPAPALTPTPAPAPAPAVSLFLPPARMAQRPASQQAAGSGRGLQIGLGRTPRHLPPALAPRSSSGAGAQTPTKRGSSSRAEVAGIDIDGDDDGELVYDEPAASAEPAMESLASSIAAARLLTNAVAEARTPNPPAVSFSGRAREASMETPSNPRYSDS